MKELKTAIEKTLKQLDFPIVEFAVEHPREEKNGDYATNVALVLAKKVGQNPRELAQKLITSLQNDALVNRLIDKIEVAGAGFINFYLKHEYLLEEAKKVVGEGYGKNKIGKGKKAIVEYSSPNIAKPFTIGHLRSTVIGDAVANLLEFTGWEVLRDNHLGDWGTQFGKQICAIKKWGNMDEIGKSENPVKDLVALYVKFHDEAEKDPKLEDEARAWFKKLEDGDREAKELWQKCIDWSWKEFSRIYELLGVKHSSEFNNGRGLGESFFEDKMGSIIELLTTKEWFKPGKEGAKLVFFPGDKLPPAMILKKDGATLYHTRDLATDKYRLDKYQPDLIINEVGAEQQLYFQQLYEMEKMLGWYKEGQRVHVMHGMYRFAQGKMSTRKGNVIWLEEVLTEAITRATELGKDNKKVAEQVGIGALKWNDLKGEARRDIVFNWDEVLNMKGNSGPFVQYSYARAKSILRKIQENNQALIINKQTKNNDKNSNIQNDWNLEFGNWNLQTEEISLLKWIYRYPEVIEEAANKYAPHIVATYVYELSARFNTFYQSCRVEEEGKVNELRYLLTQACANVIKSGLNLLGIVAPEEM